MENPTQVKFTNYTITGDELDDTRITAGKLKERASWSRVFFTVPTSRDAVNKVYDWLNSNCTGQYSAYKFHDSNSYTDYKMVVRFENRQDAVMFKLQDGHKAWEQN